MDAAMTNPVAKAEAAVETIIARRIIERKLQGFQREASVEIVAAVIEKLDWHEDDQRARLETPPGCDGAE